MTATREQIENFVNGVLSGNEEQGLNSLRTVLQQKVSEILIKKKYGDLPPPTDDDTEDENAS